MRIDAVFCSMRRRDGEDCAQVLRQRNEILEDILEGKEGLEQVQIQATRAELEVLRGTSDEGRNKRMEACQNGFEVMPIAPAMCSRADFCCQLSHDPQLRYRRRCRA